MKAKSHIIILSLLLVLSTTHELFAEGLRDYNWWWLFYEREHTARQDIFVPFRPFYMRTSEPAKKRSFSASLMPLVYWDYKAPRRNEWHSLFGLMGAADYTHPNGVNDYDFGFFPFLFYGDSIDSRDRYFLLWPFGGTVRGKLGQEKISVFLFPGVLLFYYYPPVFPPNWITLAVLFISLIPLYVEYGYGDYHAWGILWPLIQRGRSPDRDDFRILPFYAHNRKLGYYDNYSWLLLFNYQRVFEKNDEQTTFFAVPFFGRRWSRSGTTGSSTLLWPFFSWGYNTKAGGFELNFPWPLVQVQDSLNPFVYKRIYFPFFGTYRTRDRETFFITPLYFELRTFSRNFTSEYYFNFIIIWYFKRDYIAAPSPVYGTHWRYFKIWPLFQYEYDDRGNSSFNMLSLLPFRDPEGYERLYQPFWTLFEYRRFATGECRLGLLLRLYYQRWGNDYLQIQVPLLFSYAESNNRIREISFLLSMFSYALNRDGAYLKLFWIPFRIGEGDATDLACDSDVSGLPLSGSYENYYNRVCLAGANIEMPPDRNVTLFTSRCF